MVNKYTGQERWEQFPPPAAEARLEAYDKNRRLLMGEHCDLFCGKGMRLTKARNETSMVINAVRDEADKQNTIYVTANYCKVASLLFASMLFGNPPKVSVEEDGNTRQKRIKELWSNNMLDVTNHQQAVESSSLGDAFYRIRWGEMANWREEGVVIEPLPAASVFPILNPGSIKDNLGFIVTNVEKNEKGQWYLYAETHIPGKIVYELFELDGSNGSGAIAQQVPLDTIQTYAHILAQTENAGYSMDGDSLVYETGYQGLFVEHVANWTKPDRFFGVSDYTPDVVSNQAAINEMKTGILRVCLKHMDPILAVPMDVFKYDEKTDTFYARREDMQAVGLDPANGNSNLPRYITWDAKLEAATVDIDACFDSMMLSLGISPAIFGLEKYGQADSGTALRLRMTHTLWIVAQKRMYYDMALKNILHAAQYLDGKFGPTEYEPMEVSLTWPDPLPKDIKEIADALKEMVEAGICSRETAVSDAQSLEGDALTAELNRIAADRRGQWLATEGVALLTSGAIDAQEMVRMYNAIGGTEDAVEARDAPEPMPEEE